MRGTEPRARRRSRSWPLCAGPGRPFRAGRGDLSELRARAPQSGVRALPTQVTGKQRPLPFPGVSPWLSLLLKAPASGTPELRVENSSSGFWIRIQPRLVHWPSLAGRRDAKGIREGENTSPCLSLRDSAGLRGKPGSQDAAPLGAPLPLPSACPAGNLPGEGVRGASRRPGTSRPRK